MRHNWQTMNNEEKIKRVTELASQGMSASQIAAQIGEATRNAIIGFCHRKKIALPGARRAPTVPTEPKKSNVVSIKRAKPRSPKPKAYDAPAEVVVFEAPKKKATSKRKTKRGPVSIMNLPLMGTCRGPLNDEYRGLKPKEMMFCGEATEPDSSWCRACQKKYTTGRVKVRKAIDDNGEPVKAQARKRKPFQRWLR